MRTNYKRYCFSTTISNLSERVSTECGVNECVILREWCNTYYM